MKIFIDADGSPVVNSTVKIAKSFNIEVVIVKNYAHNINSDYATVITVDIEPDSADYYIANNVNSGDIVVTQDYGVAAMVLSKKALCITQNGLVISNNNIERLLYTRHIHQKLRRSKKRHSRMKKRTSENDASFAKNLKELINNQI